MIELNNKTQQDFLNRKWAQKLLDVGVDMSDAKSAIIRAIQDWTAYESNKDMQRRMERHQKQLNGNKTAKVVRMNSVRLAVAA